MLVIGVTGGLGTGKSTVTRMFGKLGAHTIDADAVARDVMAPASAGWQAVRRAFGTRVLTPAGVINRRALAGVVFARPRALARLNAIVHPRVIRRITQEIARLRRTGRHRVIAVEIPLLVEAGVRDVVDYVVVVEATKRQQVARVRRATGWSKAEILQRMQAQLPLAVKRQVADCVITNTGTRADTRRQVRVLWKRLKARPR